MPLFLFSNNAGTTLAGPISAASTTANLAAGTGVLFPSPTGGQVFALTISDAATGNTREIVYVTSRAGDTITMMRAQEGTIARAWSAGDNAENLWTAGSATVMVQESELQQQPGNFATTGGTSTSYTAVLTPIPLSKAFLLGVPIRLKFHVTNGASPTLNVNNTGASSITNPDGSNLVAGQLVAGHIFEVVYNGASFDLLTDPWALESSANTWTAGQTFQAAISGTSGTFSSSLTASALTATTGDIVSQHGNVVSNSGRLRAALGALGSGDLAAGVILNDFPSDIRGNGDYLWQELPNGLIFQSYFTVTSTGSGDVINLPNAFPTACNYVTVQESNPSNGTWTFNPTVWGTQNYTRSTFNVYCSIWTGTQWLPGANKNFRYLAIGH